MSKPEIIDQWPEARRLLGLRQKPWWKRMFCRHDKALIPGDGWAYGWIICRKCGDREFWH